jgi:hypothetical protein
MAWVFLPCLLPPLHGKKINLFIFSPARMLKQNFLNGIRKIETWAFQQRGLSRFRAEPLGSGTILMEPTLGIRCKYAGLKKFPKVYLPQDDTKTIIRKIPMG